MELLLLILSTLLILTLVCHFFYLNKQNGPEKLPLPPGHVSWPFKYFETLDYLKKAKTDAIHEFIAERVHKYKNSKCFKTYHVGQKMVFLTSAEGNKFLFSNDYKLVRSWWPDTFLKVLENAGDEITIEDVTRARKQFLSFFNEPDALARHVAITDQVVQDHFRRYWDGCNEVRVYPLARKLTFDVSFRLLADIRDREILDESLPLMVQVVRAFFALPINFPGTTFNRAIKSSRKLRKIFVDIIKERRSELLEKKNLDERNDILSRILVENYKEGKNVDDVFLAKNLVALLSAAFDNPSATITSIMKNLADLPEISEKVRKEQIEIAKSKAPGEPMSMKDIKKMKYSMSVISESLRLEPPASGTFREAIEDFNYEGFRIPKGWKVHWSIHATNRNPEYFPNPETFDPSRFERNDPIVPYSYVPFGGGQHICPGKDYAKLQILLFMRHAVRKFKWEKVNPDEQMIRDPDLSPAKGLPVRLCPYACDNELA
ncbi:cytochrome P450 716A2 [Citrus sinensis]|uniref:beta-amyrin 28-monooxygenase n=1 Tax=Citrus sinensis TaxID=2711 RepID=UPI002190B862|nr:beta-amyrin 28-monooxygenase [Citrus sinensis]KAH9727725.1 cytochrome P450 716A2 [Citrus sinensis]